MTVYAHSYIATNSATCPLLYPLTVATPLSCCLQIHHIIDEMIMGGMVMETNMMEILTHVEAQDKLLKAEVGGS